MDKLTIEQKAKAYDEALKKARQLLYIARCNHDEDRIWSLLDMFPALKDNESEDEKIRNAILGYLEGSGDIELIPGIKASKAIAWLEKQGEPKSYSWKPSEEQFEALDYAYNSCSDTERGNYYEGVLETLIEDLHRLEKQGELNDKAKVEHLIPQKGMYYTCIKDYYSSDNTHLCVKGNVYKSFFNGYIDDESHLGLSWTNSCTEKYFEPTKDEDWIVCEHDNVIGKPMQYKEFKKKVNQKFIENLKAKGLIPKLRLWNLQDANDGDVLSYRNEQWIFIYKKQIGNSSFHYYSLYSTIHQDLTIDDSAFTILIDEIVPVTKEQRDTLLKAMADAGYTFDFGKKELKKIEQKPTGKAEPKSDFELSLKQIMEEAIECGDTRNLKADAELLYNIAQKSAEWSEEDEERYLSCLKRLSTGDIKQPETINTVWLKSLKDRVQPQLKQEWGEEDETYRNYILSNCMNYADKMGYVEEKNNRYLHQNAKDWLKSLRPQMQWKVVDKEIYVKEPALAQRKDKSEPNHGYVICYDHTLTPDVYERFIMISDIYNQSHWRPSDEQMRELSIVAKGKGWFSKEILSELLEQLKKLREEWV